MNATTCPRCGAPWSSGPACPRCGLLSAGVHPSSHSGAEAKARERDWLRAPGSDALESAFREGGRALPERPTVQPRRTGPVLLDVGAQVLGGSGWPATPEQPCHLLFRQDELVVQAPLRDLWAVPFADGMTIEVEGPGEVTSGGGFIGGGVGVDGAVLGIATAALLNLMTTKRQVLSVIVIATDHGEGFFLHEGRTPAELRVTLSPVFTALRAAARQGQPTFAAPSPPALAPGALGVADRLVELGRMVDSGLLSHDEFALLKQRLLAGD